MEISNIKIEDYLYNLPEERIAKYPLPKRDSCKLLYYNGIKIGDYIFSDISDLLSPRSVLIYNISKVIKARLEFKKGRDENGARIEIFCLEPSAPSNYEMSFSATGECEWECFVGNSKKWKEGTELFKKINIEGKEIILKVERINKGNEKSIIKFSWNDLTVPFSSIIENAGTIPIPPYLNRESEDRDNLDYQTIYSVTEGSVAAPTAGLHFTDETLRSIDNRGILRQEITLHVGAGTFKPVKDNNIENHVMHNEFFCVSRNVLEDLIKWKKAENNIREIVAVGTTTVRTLESLYYVGCLMAQDKWNGIVPQWYPYNEDLPPLSLKESIELILSKIENELSGETQIMIVPGFKFRVVDGLITNFHQPGSTLMLLVSAFLDNSEKEQKTWKQIYHHALNNDYRFLSYGDACLFRPCNQNENNPIKRSSLL